MWMVLSGLARLMAPILSFTAEDVWSHMPGKEGDSSIFLTDMPEKDEAYLCEDLAKRWDRFKSVRSEATKILERARADKVIGNSLQAKLVIEADKELQEFISSFGDTLPDLFIVSGAEFGEAKGSHVYESEEIEGLKIAVLEVEGEKCERCWKYNTDIGSNKDHPTICPRCISVVTSN